MYNKLNLIFFSAATLLCCQISAQSYDKSSANSSTTSDYDKSRLNSSSTTLPSTSSTTTPSTDKSRLNSSSTTTLPSTDKSQLETKGTDWRNKTSSTSSPSSFDKNKFDSQKSMWSSRSQDVNESFSTYRDKSHVFDKSYWESYNRNNNSYWNFNDNLNWWNVPTWTSITGWYSGKWDRPRYYYYNDNNVYYSTDANYDKFVPVDSKVNVQTLISRMPKVDRRNVQWMPLGVYALTQDSAGGQNDYFSLAISKEGVIGGTYVNPDKNVNESIEGYVDSDSQRAVWKLVGKESPVYDTGVYNLTKNESSVLIHRPSGQTEQSVLIRVK